MNKLRSLTTHQTWDGTTNGNTFISDKIKLDFNLADSYTLDGVNVKITHQSTNNMYQTVLTFEVL